MESIFFRSWRVAALGGLLGILFAVLALGLPGLTLLSFVALFAAYAILAGIASLAGAVRHRTDGQVHWDAVILGIVSIGAGLVAAYHPAATALLFVLVMGAHALVVGVRMRAPGRAGGAGHDRRVLPDRRMSPAR